MMSRGANRLILGDSLQVMSSLARREDLAGKVQMIYMDPPYGIKFASNFQPEALRKRDVKDKQEDFDLASWEMGPGVSRYLASRDSFVSVVSARSVDRGQGSCLQIQGRYLCRLVMRMCIAYAKSSTMYLGRRTSC